jgi:Ca2+-transporting ATPase
VTIAFVSAVASSDNKSVLTAVQLLWVNLIMDSLAALSLATDSPDLSILNRMPDSKKDPLISVEMWKMILGQAAFQIFANLFSLYVGPTIFRLDVS